MDGCINVNSPISKIPKKLTWNIFHTSSPKIGTWASTRVTLSWKGTSSGSWEFCFERFCFCCAVTPLSLPCCDDLLPVLDDDWGVALNCRLNGPVFGGGVADLSVDDLGCVELSDDSRVRFGVVVDDVLGDPSFLLLLWVFISSNHASSAPRFKDTADGLFPVLVLPCGALSAVSGDVSSGLLDAPLVGGALLPLPLLRSLPLDLGGDLERDLGDGDINENGKVDDLGGGDFPCDLGDGDIDEKSKVDDLGDRHLVDDELCVIDLDRDLGVDGIPGIIIGDLTSDLGGNGSLIIGDIALGSDDPSEVSDFSDFIRNCDDDESGGLHVVVPSLHIARDVMCLSKSDPLESVLFPSILNKGENKVLPACVLLPPALPDEEALLCTGSSASFDVEAFALSCCTVLLWFGVPFILTICDPSAEMEAVSLML